MKKVTDDRLAGIEKDQQWSIEVSNMDHYHGEELLQGLKWEHEQINALILKWDKRADDCHDSGIYSGDEHDIGRSVGIGECLDDLKKTMGLGS